MFFWTDKECKEWCNEHQMTVDLDGRLCFNNDSSYQAEFVVPSDCGQLAAFSKKLRYLTEFESDVLLWVTSWGVFPSSENPDLFYRYRKSYGENRPLIEVPGQFVKRQEESILASLTHLCLISYWDCLLIDAEQSMVVSFDHHRKCEIRSLCKQLLTRVTRNLIDFGLKHFE